MANFTKVVTTAGLAAEAYALAHGSPLNFIAAQAGSGICPNDGMDATALISAKITSTQLSGSGSGASAIFTASFSNDAITTSFELTEVGLFCEDPANPSATILFAYLFAAAGQGDTIPTNTTPTINAYQIILTVDNGLSVTLTTEAGTYVLVAAYTDHLTNYGGIGEHALATELAPGVMSAADKIVLDRLNSNGIAAFIPSWKRQLVMGSNCTTLTQFHSHTALDAGYEIALAGEINHHDSINAAHTWLFSLVIDVVDFTEGCTCNLVANDDSVYLYIDGILINSRGTSETPVSWTVTPPAAGEHVIQIMLNNSGGTKTDLILLAGWLYNNVLNHVTWVRAATS